MASRGHLGGLAGATADAVSLMDAFGKDVVLVETVGVGQSEIEIAEVADTTLVALQPGSGDSVQVLKAGVLEIADVFVVNKSDHPMALQLQREIRSMMEMLNFSGWVPELVSTQALEGKGIDKLWAAIERARRVAARERRDSREAPRRRSRTACASSRSARWNAASRTRSPNRRRRRSVRGGRRGARTLRRARRRERGRQHARPQRRPRDGEGLVACDAFANVARVSPTAHKRPCSSGVSADRSSSRCTGSARHGAVGRASASGSATAYRVIAYDQRGHGDNDAMGPMTLRTYRRGSRRRRRVARRTGGCADRTFVGRRRGRRRAGCSSTSRASSPSIRCCASNAACGVRRRCPNIAGNSRSRWTSARRRSANRSPRCRRSRSNRSFTRRAGSRSNRSKRSARRTHIDAGRWDLRALVAGYPKPLLLALADPRRSVVLDDEREEFRARGGAHVRIEVFAGASHSLQRDAFDRVMPVVEAFLAA